MRSEQTSDRISRLRERVKAVIFGFQLRFNVFNARVGIFHALLGCLSLWCSLLDMVNHSSRARPTVMCLLNMHLNASNFSNHISTGEHGQVALINLKDKTSLFVKKTVLLQNNTAPTYFENSVCRPANAPSQQAQAVRIVFQSSFSVRANG